MKWIAFASAFCVALATLAVSRCVAAVEVKQDATRIVALAEDDVIVSSNNKNDGNNGNNGNNGNKDKDKPKKSKKNDPKDGDPDDGDAGGGNDGRKKKNDGPAND
jgi:hypothetical protein